MHNHKRQNRTATFAPPCGWKIDLSKVIIHFTDSSLPSSSWDGPFVVIATTFWTTAHASNCRSSLTKNKIKCSTYNQTWATCILCNIFFSFVAKMVNKLWLIIKSICDKNKNGQIDCVCFEYLFAWSRNYQKQLFKNSNQ